MRACALNAGCKCSAAGASLRETLRWRPILLAACSSFLPPRSSSLNTSTGFSTSHKDTVMDRVTVLLIRPCLTTTALANVTACECHCLRRRLGSPTLLGRLFLSHSIWMCGKISTNAPERSPASRPCWCSRFRRGRTCWRPTSASAPACRATSRSARWWTPGSRLSRRRWRRTCERRARRTWKRLRTGRSCHRSSWILPWRGSRWGSPSGSPCTTPGSRARWSQCSPEGLAWPQAGACCSASPCLLVLSVGRFTAGGERQTDSF